MKKQLFSAVAALTFSAVVAQTPSPSWSITQNGSFSITSAGVRYLDAVDQNVVWLIGYDGTTPSRSYNWFSKTTDGGNTYTSGNIFPDTLTYSIGNIEGIDGLTAWVSAFKKIGQNKGVIYKTIDGGSNWTDMTAAGMFTATTSFADVVSFLTPSNGIALGDPVGGEYELWTTTNGGTSWTPVPGANIPNPIASEFAIVNLYDKQGSTNMWFGTNKGRIYYTTDAGLNWNVTALTAPSNATVTEVAFVNATNGLAYVAIGPSTAPTIQAYSTTDGGVTWNLTTSNDPDMGKNDICGIPGTTYFASAGADAQTGNTVISITTDNGYSWTNYGGANIQYLNVDFVDAQHGWAGSFSDINNAALGGIWKYAGVTSNFDVPQFICLSGATSTLIPTNMSMGSSLTYSWSSLPSANVAVSSVTASAPTITFSSVGTYSIVLVSTDNFGVSIGDTSVVKVLNNCSTPGVSFNNNFPASVCNNAQFNFTLTGSGVNAPTYTVSTTPAAGVTITPIISGPGTSVGNLRFGIPGAYTVTCMASNSYSTVTTTKTITILNCNPVANFNLIPPTLCVDSTYMSTIVTATNISTPTTGVTYVWTVTPAVTFTALGASRRYRFIQPNTYTISLTGTNGSGTSSYSTTIEVSSCYVGIEQYSLLNNISVYPNPAREQLNVVLPTNSEIYKIKLINVVGATVYEDKTTKNSNGTVTISLANKPQGIYFLSVETGSEKAIKKIVVE